MRSPLLLATGVVLGVVVTLGTAPVGAAPGSSAAAAMAAADRLRCPEVDRGFRPTALSVPRVLGRTRVLARGRDRRGVPRPPPLTDRGKWQLGWDRTVRADARYGVVRLTAHTYPWSGAYGSALGNRLLTRLRKGATLVATGPGGARQCYRVVKRVRVGARAPLYSYYSYSGPHRLAILVCSGRRRGPGDWSHRTIWFAAPVPPAGGGR